MKLHDTESIQLWTLFAAAALDGHNAWGGDGESVGREDAVRYAVEQADAMMVELAKRVEMA